MLLESDLNLKQFCHGDGLFNLRLPVALPGKNPSTLLKRSNFGHDGRLWPKNLPALAADFEETDAIKITHA